MQTSNCCDAGMVNGRCTECGEMAFKTQCPTCYDIKTVTENIGQRDEKTFPCPDCIGFATVDSDDRYNNEVNK